MNPDKTTSKNKLSSRAGARALAGALMAVAMVMALAMGVLTAGNAAAQAYPAKAITLNSSLAPGSSYDVIFRVIQEDWRQRLGKDLVINPVVGGLGTLAPASLLRAQPDGYTIAFVFAAPITLSPQMMSTPPYDPLKDFAPVIQLTRHGLLYIAAPSAPYNNFNEFIAQAKANPGKLSVGYAGAGSQVHLLQIASTLGVEFLGVPYKSSTQLAPAVMGGETNAGIHTVGAVAELIKSGRIKPLFIASPNRSAQLPNVPSISESHPGLEGGSWFGILAPANTGKDHIEWLNREFAASMKTDRVKQQLALSAYDLVAGTPEQFAEVIRKEIPVYTRIVKQYNIKAE